jgi:hypothetical protein
MKWIVDSYELLTTRRFAGECLCPDDAEDNGQFLFFGPLFCDVCQIGHHSEILLANLGYIPDMKHTTKGSFYILGNLIRTSVFLPQFSDVAKVRIICKPV